MKNFAKGKRFLSGALAALLLTTALASCNGLGNGEASSSGETVHPETDESTSSSTTESEDEKASLDLPEDLRFDGQSVTFLCRNDAEWTSDDIYSEGGGEDTISNAVFRRNQLVQKRLGVEIKQMWADGNDVIRKTQLAATSNMDDFHVVISHTANAATMTTSGYLRNLKANTVNYLDLSKSYWDQNLSSELAINGRVYFATGDIMTIDNDATFCLLFNKTLAKDHKLPNMYDLVDKMEWTMERQLEFMETVNTEGAEDDRIYGLACTNDTPYAIYYGGGIRAVDRDSGTNSFVYAVDVDRADDVATISKRILDGSLTLNISNKASSSGDTVMQVGQKYFGGGKALFYSDVLQSAERMRAFNIDFGVLPNPLYDVNQKSYYHMMHYTGNVLSIPRSGRLQGHTLDCITATLEAMAYYSVDTLTEQYYDINLTSTFINDPESAPMIDLILETRVYDLAYYYDATANLSNISGQLAGAMQSGGGGLGSLNRRLSGQVNKKLTLFVEKMDEMAKKVGE